jgi:aspartyl-tRNA(Asn)/glutamyl-tRNA(Gln) amidotransferase subunit C
MEITNDILDKMARLARLHLAPAARESMQQDFQQMLNFVDKLQEVDTEGVEPLIYLTESQNRMATDEPEKALGTDAVIKNAPDANDSAIRVPRVVK